jgi:hypothetical protein
MKMALAPKTAFNGCWRRSIAARPFSMPAVRYQPRMFIFCGARLKVIFARPKPDKPETPRPLSGRGFWSYATGLWFIITPESL